MRGKLTEQDLTNYALNDGLDARERLYVESMLGAKEECRNDVYQMLEMSQWLERGFELESNRTVPRLTRDQRQQLLEARPAFQLLPVVRKAATALSLAACVAFVLSTPGSWMSPSHPRAMAAAVKTEVSRMVSDAMTSDSDEDDYTLWVSPQPTGEDDSAYIQASSDGLPVEAVDPICTPPTADQAMSGTELE